MSQIKLKHSGGNGVIIAAPSSNPAADRTLTLPGDGDSTIDTLGRAGNILQVVQSSATSKVSNTTTTFADSGLSATITPTSSSNKILVLLVQSVNLKMTSAVGGGFQILRGSTVIQEAGAIDSSNRPIQIYIGNFPSSTDWYFHHPMQVLDSPSTTSAITYKTQMRLAIDGSQREIQAQPQTTGSIDGISRMTLMEVSA